MSLIHAKHTLGVPSAHQDTHKAVAVSVLGHTDNLVKNVDYTVHTWIQEVLDFIVQGSESILKSPWKRQTRKTTAGEKSSRPWVAILTMG